MSSDALVKEVLAAIRVPPVHRVNRASLELQVFAACPVTQGTSVPRARLVIMALRVSLESLVSRASRVLAVHAVQPDLGVQLVPLAPWAAGVETVHPAIQAMSVPWVRKARLACKDPRARKETKARLV